MPSFVLQIIMLISELESTTSGLLLSVWGEIGTSVIASSVACSNGPPDESAYAVEPVGVEMTMPSAR